MMNIQAKPKERRLAPQLEKQRRNRRVLLVVACGALAVAAIAMFQIKPVYREIKAWRSHRLAAKAEVEIGAENWPTAQAFAQAAYQLKPDDAMAIRAVARLNSLTGATAAALPFWDMLRQMNVLTITDRRMWAEDLLRAGSQDQARTEVEGLLAEGRNDPENLRVAAKWAASEKRYDQAMDFASRAQVVEPENKQGRLLLGLLQCEAPRTGSREVGIQTLMQLVDDRTKVGLDALIFLATRRDLPHESAQSVVTHLREHPLAAENHRLLALDLEISIDPSQREAAINTAMQHYKAADPAAQRAFGVWLNSRREYERTLELIPVEEAMKRKDFLLVTLDAMAAQKRWTEIEEVLNGKQVPLDEVYMELFLARSAMELGMGTSADLHWRKAHLAAAPSPEQMWFLATYAEKIGQYDEAERAFRSLTANSTTARPAYEGLLRLSQKKHDTDVAVEVLGEMVKRWPHDASVRNDVAYFNLLRGEDLEESLQTARELVTEDPSSLAHRTTLALANLRLNDPVAALDVYTGRNIPWDHAAPSHRAVHAAVLGMNANEKEAREQASTLALDSLWPEERQLISPWRAP